MKLYQLPQSTNCRKAWLVAEHLGIELELVRVDVMNGGTRTPEFLKMNPNAKIPVLKDGDRVIWESNAIMCYLASQKDNTLWPKDSSRYDIMKWQHWESCHFGPAVQPYLIERLIRKGGSHAPVPEQAEKDLQRFAAVLNGQLETTKYVVGDTLTLADFAIAVHLGYQEAANLPTTSFTHIQRWLKDLAKLPAWEKTTPPPIDF